MLIEITSDFDNLKNKIMTNIEMLLEQKLIDYTKAIEAAHRKSWPTLEFSASFTKGGKYYRVFKEFGGSKSAHSFVDLQGNIWKAASWKMPAKNFIRGNIFSIKNVPECGF